MVDPYLEYLITGISIVANEDKVCLRPKMRVTRERLVTYRLNNRRPGPPRRGCGGQMVCIEDLLMSVSS